MLTICGVSACRRARSALFRDARFERVEDRDVLGRNADPHQDILADGLELKGEERTARAFP
jgi:hypothetical protein